MSAVALGLLARAAEVAPGPEQLQLLLEVWRLAPDERLVVLIDELSNRNRTPPIETIEAWTEAVQLDDAAAIPALVDGLYAATWATLEHLEMLMRRDPDPRLARTNLPSKYWHEDEFGPLTAPHGLSNAELPDEALPLLDRIVGALYPMDPVEVRMRADVFADQDDDGPRMVYADYLLERGDPRGELIARQLAVPDSAEELEGVHFKGCLGPLARAVVSGRLERGFLVEATITNGAEVALVAHLPDWCTVRSLAVPEVGGAALRRLLANPALAMIERLSDVTAQVLADHQVFPAVQRIDLGWSRDYAEFSQLRPESFPALVEMSGPAHAVVPIAQCPLSPRLELVELRGFLLNLGFVFVETPEVPWELVVHFEEFVGSGAVLTRRERVLHTEGVSTKALVRFLDALPANTFREVHVAERLEHADYARLGVAAARHGGLVMG